MDYQNDLLYETLYELDDVCVDLYKLTMNFLYSRKVNHIKEKYYQEILAEYISEYVQYPVLKELGCCDEDTHEYYVAQQFSNNNAWTDLAEIKTS
ncbi:MAG: hypothetical protein ACKO96_04900 [Flammeovirgaceae bacterium]